MRYRRHEQQEASTISTVSQSPPKRHLPLFEGLLPFDRSHLTSDIIAGIILAALGIPEVMGYSKIAGMPIVTGLYTLILPVLAFAILGSSRHLVVGADSATAAILAAGLAGMAQLQSPKYIALAGLVALLAGGFLLLARLFRLGFLADFLSRTVLIGFLTGVGIQVAIGQLAGLFGMAGGGHGPIEQVINTFKNLPKTNPLTLGISLAVLAIILLLDRFLPKFPGALVAVIGAIAASWAFQFASHGVTLVGTVPGGLPSLGLPAISLDEISPVLGTALSCFIVIIAQSAATSRAYAFRYDESVSENADFVGLAVANAAAGLSGTFVVNGSPTKTAMVEIAGGRSQLSQVTTAVIVLIVLLFLTGPISSMPNAVLAAIVFLIGVKLIDVRGMCDIFRKSRAEFYLAVITAAAVIFVGVEQGIILAIVLSLLLHVSHSYRPNTAVLVPGEDGLWREVPVRPGSQTEPGLIVYRFGRDLFYANANHFAQEIKKLVGSAPSPACWLILDAEAITGIDYSAYLTIGGVVKALAKRKITLLVSGLPDDVRAQFDRVGLTAVIGADHFYHRLGEAVEAFHQSAIKQTEREKGSGT